MGTLEDYLDDESIDNLFNRYSNVIVAEIDVDAQLENGKMVGQVVVSIESNKEYIQTKDFIEFYLSKAKWKSAVKNDKQLVIVNSHWVKFYNHDPKLKIMVPILKSKVVNNKRVYFEDHEAMELTYKQYQRRRILKDFGDKYTYRQMEAYFNMSRRFQETQDYYKALNETAKQFCVEHLFLKDVIFPEINNAKKKYKKDWHDFLLKQYQSRENAKAINEFIEERKSKKEKTNIIEMPKRV